MTPQVSKIAVRVSTDPRFGYGHIARQLAVRKHLDGKVSWFTDPCGKQSLARHIPAQDDIIEEKDKKICEEIFRWANANKNCVLICDSYHISPSYFDTCSNKVFFFCDYEQEQVNNNITLVNAQPTVGFSDRHLFGPAFFAIDTRGKSQQALNFSTLDTPVNCLISFGSVDTSNCTSSALNAILEDKQLSEQIKPVCLIGQHAKHKKAVHRLAAEFQDAEIIEDCESILDLNIACPIAIGAPGLSHAERLYAGIATVLVPQSERHRQICKAWQEMGCSLYVPDDIRQIGNTLHLMLERKMRLASLICRNGQNQIDGAGGAKIAKSILREAFC